MGSKLDEFEVISTIGRGSHGTVKKIRRKYDGKFFVWKEIHYASMSEGEKQCLVFEVNLLRVLKHPNIVQFFHHFVEKKSGILYIIMEYCAGGDLSILVDRCKRTKSYLEEHLIWRILKQVCEALRVCHEGRENKIVLHRDIKPANVFLDKEGNVKLGDFGLARTLASNASFAQTFVGTPYYMSPEVIDGREYNCKSDIWSLGCLIYELCTLKPPFNAANQNELAYQIKLGRYSKIPAHYSDDLWDIIRLMLRDDDFLRPIPLMILQHHKLSDNLELDYFNENSTSCKFENNEKDDITDKRLNADQSIYNISWKFDENIENETCVNNSDETSNNNSLMGEMWQTLIRVPPKPKEEMTEQEKLVDLSVMRDVESLIRKNESEKSKHDESDQSNEECFNNYKKDLNASHGFKSLRKSLSTGSLENDSSQESISKLAKKFENMQCTQNTNGEVSLSDLVVSSCMSEISNEKSIQTCVCGGINSDQWRQRLSTMRAAEMSIKERELKVEAKERDLVKREKRVQALEEDARHHLIRAQIYLKQSRFREKKVDTFLPYSKKSPESFNGDSSSISCYATSEYISTSAPLITTPSENPFLQMRQQHTIINDKKEQPHGRYKSNTLDNTNRRKTADIIYVDQNPIKDDENKTKINDIILHTPRNSPIPIKNRTPTLVKAKLKEKSDTPNSLLTLSRSSNKENIIKRAFSFNKRYKRRSLEKENIEPKVLCEKPISRPRLRLPLGTLLKNEDISNKLKVRQVRLIR